MAFYIDCMGCDAVLRADTMEVLPCQHAGEPEAADDVAHQGGVGVHGRGRL